MRIQDNVFVITGAGSGIGRAVTLELLARGARVAAVDRTEGTLAETVALAGSAGRARISSHVLDITDRDAVGALPAAVLEQHGRIDGVMSIAGIIQPFVPVVDLRLETAERLMNVNFWGTYYLDTAFIPHLRQRPAASLVNVSSMGALAPVPGQGAYGASKAAVMLLAECLYAELRDSTIAVTLVIPGGVATNITTNSGVEMPRMAATKTPKTTTAADAARQIVDAVEKGTFRVLIGSDAKMLDRVARVSPTRAITMIADRMKALMG